MSRRLGAALAGLVLAAACSGERPAPSPPPQAPASSPGAGGLRPLTSRENGTPFTAPAPVDEGRPAAIGGASISGTIRVAPDLAARVSRQDVLYVIARNHETRKVVAVRREEGARFPHVFELSAADVMVKDQPFAGPFDVTARLSKTGDALAAPGDLEGVVQGVAEGARSVAILVDKVRQ